MLQRLVCRPHQEFSSDSEVSDLSGPYASYDLYIPAPRHLKYDEVVDYYLTTRNFFAWMFEKPLVGTLLGSALCSLQDRMNEWRYDREENEDDLLAYIDVQGYTDFRDCPDHALAVLHWSEQHQNNDVWIDSFVHCTGMNDRLVSSQEFDNISITTKALITRANLEMAVRLDRASAALADFCESDSVINQRLNISDSSLRHLERFRTWLQGFYVQRHGYWPPHVVKSKYGKVRPLPKHTLLTMYSDFRNLYQYLVNSQADPFHQPEVSRSVLSVLTKYDEQMKFTPLPCLIPLLPVADFDHGDLRRSKSSFSVFKSKKTRHNSRKAAVASSLAIATNIGDMRVVGSAIVREYALFERSFTIDESERITATEARMARWMLIYALLQIIISVTNAPDQVRDVEGVDYPLCVQTAGCPPWTMGKQARRRSSSTNSIQKAFSITNTRTEPERRRSASISYPISRTALHGSSSGPPPSNPPPNPSSSSRTPTRVEQANARKETSISNQSKIPIRVVSPLSAVKSNHSRIPVPIAKPMPQIVTPIESDIDDYTDSGEDMNDFNLAPALPQKSSRRSATPSMLSLVQTSTGSPDFTMFFPDESLTPPPLSAKSIKRLSSSAQDLVVESSKPELQKPVSFSPSEPELQEPVSFDPSESETQESVSLSNSPPMTLLESSFPKQEDYFNQPVDLSSRHHSTSTDSTIQSPAVRKITRGRTLTRSSEEQTRQDSVASSISDCFSSGTEQHTLASQITTPSLYSHSTYDDRFTHQSQPSIPSFPKELSFSKQNAPLLTTITTSSSVHSTHDSIISMDTHNNSTPVITLRAFVDEQSNQSNQTGESMISLNAPHISVHRSRNKAGDENEEENNNNGRATPPTIDRLSEQTLTIHTTAKNRRQRLFTKSEEPVKQGNLAARRRSKGLVALVSKTLVSRPLVSPALPTTPLTPMSFMSFESTAQSSRTGSRAGTIYNSPRPSHQRKRSSELAQQFRQEIGWKRAAGWDESVECLLLGDLD